jgi:hypothetical protein
VPAPPAPPLPLAPPVPIAPEELEVPLVPDAPDAPEVSAARRSQPANAKLITAAPIIRTLGSVVLAFMGIPFNKSYTSSHLTATPRRSSLNFRNVCFFAKAGFVPRITIHSFRHLSETMKYDGHASNRRWHFAGGYCLRNRRTVLAWTCVGHKRTHVRLN